MAEDSRSVLRAHSLALDVARVSGEHRDPKARAKLRALHGLRLLERHVVSACEGVLRGAPILTPKLGGYVVQTQGRPKRFTSRPTLILSASPAGLSIAEQTPDGYVRRPFLDSDFVVEDLDAFALVAAHALEQHLYQLRSRFAEYQRVSRRADAIFRALGHVPMP